MSKTLQGHRTKLNKKEAPTVSYSGTKRLVTADEELLSVYKRGACSVANDTICRKLTHLKGHRSRLRGQRIVYLVNTLD